MFKKYKRYPTEMKKVLVLVLISIIVIAFYNTYIKKPVIENFHHPWRELNIWATYTFFVPSNPIKAKDIYNLYEFKKLVDKYMLKYRGQKSTKEERIKIKDYLVNSDNVFRKHFYMNEKQYAAFEKKTGYGKKRADFLIHRYIFENFIKPNANFKDSNYANKIGSDYFKKNIRSNIKLKIFNKFRSEKYKIKKYLVTSDCLDATNKRDRFMKMVYNLLNLIKYGSNYKYTVIKNNEKDPNSGTFVKYITKPNIKITKPKKIHTCPTKNISITKPKPAPPKIFAVPKPPTPPTPKVPGIPPGTKFDPKKEVCLDKSKVQTLLVKSSGPKGAIKHYDYYCDAKVKKKDEIKKEIKPTPYNSSTQGCDAVLDEHRRTGPGNSKNKLCYGKVYNKIKTKMNCKDPDSSCNGTVTRTKTNGRYRYPNLCHCVTKQYI
jgi:hypothetical protein